MPLPLKPSHGKAHQEHTWHGITRPRAAAHQVGRQHQQHQQGLCAHRQKTIDRKTHQHAGQQSTGQGLWNAIHHASKEACDAGQDDEQCTDDESAHGFVHAEARTRTQSRQERRARR